MYLKRIELEGFKSFADRTVVPIERGLTGIVGPNGCGKSNVVDALMWVMGERSAKNLRADSMDDVIFKGAEGRPAAPYAMVEIILGDDGGEVVEAGGEVAVGRRLFRTGESEFLLHGRKVRRKDVREMLMDTGLGVRGYMVLAQGKIDAVLAANPTERRSVFEEAAGISRYRERKKETERKLASVGQDLARVEDVLDEVQKAVRSLRYQAGKARRFVEMRDRYRELRVRVGLAERGGLGTREEELQSAVRVLEEQIEALRSERNQVESVLEKLQAEEEALRGRHDGLRQEASENKERVAGLEERIHGLQARATEAEQRRERDQQRLSDLENSGQERSADTAGLEQDLRSAAEQRDHAEQGLAAAEETFASAKETYRSLRERLESLRAQVLEALSERTRFHNQVAQAAKQRSEAEGGWKARQRRLHELEAEEKSLAWDLGGADQEAVSARQQAIEAEQAMLKLLEQQEHLRGESMGHAETAGQARRRAAAAQARLEALAGVEEDGSGLPPHLAEILRQEDNGVDGLLLAEVHIDAPWDRLLEDLLGRMQYAFWASSREAAPHSGDGPVDLFFAGGAAPSHLEIEGATPLRSHLRGAVARVDALCARLGAVYTTADGAAAARLAESHPEAVFLSADGQLHGGAFVRVGMASDTSAGMLARRNARQQAAQELQSAETEFERASAHEAEIHARLATLAESLSAAEGQQRSALGRRETAEARLLECQGRRARAREEIQALLHEAEQLQQQVVEAQAAEQQAADGRDRSEQDRLRFNQELESAQGCAEHEASAFESASAAVQEARVEANRVRQLGEHLQSRIGEAQRQTKKESAEEQKLRHELEELGRRAEQLRADAAQAQSERSALLEVRQELGERVEQAAQQLQRAAAALAEARGRRSGESERLDSLMEERQERALEVQKVQMRGEELARGVFEEFGQGLEDLAQALAVDPLRPLGEDQPLDGLQQELGDLRRRLEAIGSVNLDAVKELEEREERENFLSRERDDLHQARGNLLDTLEELDEQCRVRFLATFEAVQANFEQIFRRLFRGGRASVALTEGVDPLEAGIEVSVRPPGKQLRSINLLSGGERTLTALALLLSVFQSRPSPFCLLDEVDAALDDANVQRFLDAIQDFTDRTQFMVVTHNRITMASCERLFGVTMRKRGVSMVVSVELSEIPEIGGGRFDPDGDAVPVPERTLPLPTAP